MILGFLNIEQLKEQFPEETDRYRSWKQILGDAVALVHEEEFTKGESLVIDYEQGEYGVDSGYALFDVVDDASGIPFVEFTGTAK